MIDRFGINCAAFAKASACYDEVLGVLGYSQKMDFGVAIGYGRDGHPDFQIVSMIPINRPPLLSPVAPSPSRRSGPSS